MTETMTVFLDHYSSRTNAILGALLSGGDAVKLAQQMVESQSRQDESERVVKGV